MRLEPADWRRVFLAAAITALASPFLLNSTRANDQPAVANGQGIDVASNLRGSGGPTTVAESSVTDLGFMAGPSTTLEPAQIMIGVPAVAPANEMDTNVGYQSLPPIYRKLPRPCAASQSPAGLALGGTITLTNISNSHTTTCNVTTHLPLREGEVLVLSEEVYNDLGDQVDAPLPVHISWK